MRKATVLLVVMTVLITFSVPALATDDPSPGRVDPESPLFVMQQIIDKVSTRLTADATDRAHGIVSLLGVRIGEIEAMVQRGRPDIAAHLAQRTSRLAGILDQTFDQMIEDGVPMDGAAAVAEATGEAVEVLNDLLNLEESGLPPEAEEGLETALEAVQEGRNRAVDILALIADGTLPGNAENAQAVLEDLGLEDMLEDLLPDPAEDRQGPPFETEDDDPEDGNGNGNGD